MPSRVLSVGTSETKIEANKDRTVLIIQNLDTGTDALYFSDESGNVSGAGIELAAKGGSITLRRTDGEEPEKAWYLQAAAAATPVRVLELFGVPQVFVVQVTQDYVEPTPQQPNTPADAPLMRAI